MKQKRLYGFVLILIITIQLLTLTSHAHQGRTDANGGHYNRSTGEYHYHHGYSAHQHIDGICPYDNDNKDKSYSSESVKQDSVVGTIKENNKDNNENNFFKNICGIFIGFWWIIIPLIAGVFNYIKEKWINNKKIAQNDSIKANNTAVILDSKDKNIKTNISQNLNNKYVCPKCGGRLNIKHGRYGAFIGCTNYPRCKYTKNLKNK